MPARTRTFKPIHPGDILRFELLEPLGISMYRLSRETGMPADRVGRLVKGTRAITADTALRLARYFGTSPQFWMNLQAHFDLEVARISLGNSIERQIKPRKAA